MATTADTLKDMHDYMTGLSGNQGRPDMGVSEECITMARTADTLKDMHDYMTELSGNQDRPDMGVSKESIAVCTKASFDRMNQAYENQENFGNTPVTEGNDPKILVK